MTAITETVPDITEQNFQIGDTTNYHNYMMSLQQDFNLSTTSMNILAQQMNALAQQLSQIEVEVQADRDYVDTQVADFPVTVIAAKLAETEAIPANDQLEKNKRYFVPENAAATMPSVWLNDGDWVEIIPVGNLIASPAELTFADAVIDSGGASLAAGTHDYNHVGIRKFIYNNGSWV